MERGAMAHYEINHSPEPIRLFQSNALEFFTHIHPAVIVVIWAPVIVYFLAGAIATPAAGASLLYIPAGLLAGLFLWTFAEYTLHRFVFHYRARGQWQERIIFLFHGIHHVQPHCKTRLVMPPVVSIPLALVFYGALHLIVGVALGAPHWVAPMFAGLLIGYLIYDLTHYATHHLPMNGRYLKFLKKYHMLHHFKTPDQRYGVSSPLWDWVFGTYPA
jgi:sterol desaturase/sphingolipid hydroxylase (fatty acid hydroxylase superfamily)